MGDLVSMFLHYFSKKHQARKSAKELLESAERVRLYRGDLLSAEAIAVQLDLEKKLSQQLSEKSFDAKGIDQALAELHHTLVKNGGKVYPISSLGDFVEMIVMAVIVAGAVKGLLLMPFKIPTNSMWPTYYGKTAVVRSPEAPAPHLGQLIWHKITDWSSTYLIDAEASGEVKIPLEFVGYNHRAKEYRVRQRSRESSLQEIVIGNTVQSFSVPAEFNFDAVLLRTFFPDFAEMPLQRQDGERWEKVIAKAMAENRIVESPSGTVLLTGKKVKEGQRIFNFDVLTGDMVFANRIIYHFVNPEAGDAIIFRTHRIPGLSDRFGNPSQNYYIKRLAGLPGDELFVDEGKLYRNGKLVTSPEPMALNCQRAISRGYYGYLADVGNQPYAAPLTFPYKVTQGFYALGDNSANSFDSRGWGEVPPEDVVGKPLFILHPFSPRWGWAK